jgi:hypothetical protein
LAAAIGAHGLATSLPALPKEPLDFQRWSALAGRIAHGRITGLWAQAIADGALAATPAQALQAATEHAVAIGVKELLERFLLEVVNVLTQSGIDYRVLKGTAVAHLDYPDPRLRTFGDIDVLVPADDFDRAVTALVGAGCTRRTPELRPGFDRRFGKGAVLVGPQGFELDLHRTFVSGPFGLWSHPADLFAAASSFAVAGVELRALTLEDRFLHACFHAALTRWVRLSTLRDVAQLLIGRELDVDQVRGRAADWRADAVIARGVTLAWDTLALSAVTPLSRFAATYALDRHELRAVQASLGEAGERPSKAVEGLRAIPGVRLKAAYARAFLWPSAERRQIGHVVRWSRAARLVPGWLRLRRGIRRSRRPRPEVRETRRSV